MKHAICSNTDEPRGYHTEKSQRHITHKITQTQSLKCDASQLIRETDSQTKEQPWACQGGGEWERGGLGVWSQQMQAIIYRKIRPYCKHRELCSTSSHKPWWEEYIYIF